MNRRAPLTRKRPMPKGKARGFNSTLRPKSPRTGGVRFRGLAIPEFREAVRGMPCCVCGCRTGAWLPVGRNGWVKVVVDPHHVRTRGAAGADRENLVPLARHLHDELHQHGKRTFARKYGVDLEAVARRTWLDWCAETGRAA